MTWEEFAQTCPELAALGGERFSPPRGDAARHASPQRLGRGSAPTATSFKLYGRARAVEDTDRRAAYRAAIKARIDWEPDEPDYHLFALDVGSAGFVVFGEHAHGLACEPAGGLRRWSQRLE